MATVAMLGGFSIRVGERVAVDATWARQKPLALVKLLALQPDRVMTRSRVVAALWPDLPQAAALAQLRKNRLYLRRALGDAGYSDEIVVVSGDRVALSPNLTTDLDGFRQAAHVARERRTDATLYEVALAKYGGDLLPDDTAEEWAEAPRADARAAYMQLLGALTQVHEAQGRLDAAVECAGRLIEADPLNEEAHRSLIRLHALAGRRDLAVRQYEQCRDTLRNELGVEPETETQTLYRQVAAGRVQRSGTEGSGDPFVGREREISTMREAFERARAGRAQTVFLSGDPGVGKTRTAETFCTYARARGARIHWGRSYEGDSEQAFGPWVQVIRSCTRDMQMQSADDSGLPGLPPFDPATERASGGFGAQASQGTQHRIFAAVADFLRAVARRQPLLVALDDLHWADLDSLRLLRFLLRELADARIVFLGTYRDAEAAELTQLADLVAEVRRRATTRVLPLTGLEPGEIADLVALTLQVEPPVEFTSALSEQTRGNPLFLTEILQLVQPDDLRRDSWSITIPQQVRDVIHRRLERLSEKCQVAMEGAAVIGQEFDVAVLSGATETPEVRLLALLDVPLRAHLIREGETTGEFSFAHPLIRSTLYEGIALDRRATMHHRVAETLEALYGDLPGEHLSELAFHFHRALPAGTAKKAVDYAMRAGERAMSTTAYEESIRLFESALGVAQSRIADSVRMQCEIRLRLATAHHVAGRGPQAGAHYQQVMEAARSIGSTELFARALIRGSAMPHTSALVVEEQITLLEDTIAELGDAADPALRAELLARLAQRMEAQPWSPRREAAVRDAVALGRGCGDALVLSRVLLTCHDANASPDNLDERLRMKAEAMPGALHASEYWLMSAAHVRHVTALLESGNLAEADREISALASLSTEYKIANGTRWVAVFRAMRCLLRGDLVEAEALMNEALRLGQEVADPDAPSIFGAQLFQLRWHQGRLQELEPAVAQLSRAVGSFGPWRIALALLYAENGQLAQARAEIDSLAVDNFRQLPRGRFWMVSMVLLAQACTLIGDRERAAAVYELLAPFAERPGVMAFANVCTGSNERPLGILCTTLGRWDEAGARFERALARNRAMGALPWVARTQVEYADLLSRRDAPGDRERATAMNAEAQAAAAELGLKLPGPAAVSP